LESYTHLHDAKDEHRARKPHQEDKCQSGLAKQALEPEYTREGHVPEHLGELCVSKRERPETQVRSRVRDAAEAELDRMNHLVDYHLTKIVLLLDEQ
jgi:hypothetical protein